VDFTQTDPLQADVAQAYPSAYVYGNNNPNMYTDPSGMRGQAGGLPSQCFGMDSRQIALDSIQAGSNLPGSVANGFISIGNWVNPFNDIPKVPKVRIDGACDVVSDLATGSVTFVASGGAKAIMAAPSVLRGGLGAAKSGVALLRALGAEKGCSFRLVKLASGAGGLRGEMSVVRSISKGEKIADLVTELGSMSFITGNEFAVVKLGDGSRAIVTGGSGGITFAEGQVARIFAHTHPFPACGGPIA
jgi:hypothetical protein